MQKKLTNKKRLISLSVIIALISVYLLAQIFILWPSRVVAIGKRKEITNDRRELLGKGWPLNESRLKQLLVQTNQRRRLAEIKRASLFQRVAQPFQADIAERFGNSQNFQRQISRLDYQEEFKRLENYLTEKQVIISPEVFKLSEDTVGLENYKLVLQLWTIKAVVKAAYDSGLEIADVPAEELPVPEDGEAPERLSDLAAMPIVPYLPAAHVGIPYLLRIPVRVRFRGTVRQLHTFLLSTATGKTFLCVDHIQVKKPIPPEVGYNNTRIEARVECSTFYILDSESGRKMMKKPAVKLLPKGA